MRPLTDRQTDTVLAALRLWQQHLGRSGSISSELLDIATEHGQLLNENQIDILCQRINGQ